MSAWRTLTVCCYLGFLAGLFWLCFRHPIPDDFDRYMYEAIVRLRRQPADVVYSIVKYENPRAEQSSILDSPDHMLKLQPLYAIRPAYLWLIALGSEAGLSIQNAINLISAASFWGIGVLLFVWTGHALPSALLIAYAPILVLGRLGTPDALSAFLVLLGLWAVWKGHVFGLAPLLLSVWVRTDNVLLVLIVLIWLVYERRLSWLPAAALSAVAIASVLLINHVAHNYGWAVLFHWTFLSGYRSPADIPPNVTVREYVSAVLQGLEHLFSYVALWILLGLAAWCHSRSCRSLLAVAGLACAAHFLLYPSTEQRYLIWAFVVIGVAFIDSVMLPDRNSFSLPGTVSASTTQSFRSS
jgi:hypothetical protein